MDQLFSPCVSLIWRGYGHKLTRHYFPNRIVDTPLLRQFMNEAKIPSNNGLKVRTDQLDAIIDAASKHGYCVETIGGPDEAY